ncbi:Uncharacterised protein [Bordetella pertussis]|nr:Uncharacterised protein [Bordetella pertussis]
MVPTSTVRLFSGASDSLLTVTASLTFEPATADGVDEVPYEA